MRDSKRASSGGVDLKLALIFEFPHSIRLFLSSLQQPANMFLINYRATPKHRGSMVQSKARSTVNHRRLCIICGVYMFTFKLMGQAEPLKADPSRAAFKLELMSTTTNIAQT